MADTRRCCGTDRGRTRPHDPSCVHLRPAKVKQRSQADPVCPHCTKRLTDRRHHLRLCKRQRRHRAR